MEYAIKATSPHGFDSTVERARAELAQEGFGVLTEIDMQAKMLEKLDRNMDRYLILGACNPPLAWDAVHAEPDVGVLLPCNVCVYEKDGAIVVSAMDPNAALSMIEDPTVHRVAADARKRLVTAVANTCAA